MTLSEARQIANAPLPVLDACSDDEFKRLMLVVLASLPKRNSGEVDGKLMVGAYRGKLGGFSAAQIGFLWDTVLERCQWFPSIAECLTILAEWERDDAAVKLQERAKALVFWDRQNRFDETMTLLAKNELSQHEIDVLPERWKEMAETYGYLCRGASGGYFARVPGAVARLTDNRRPDPRCSACQDLGRILTLEGEEADCDCVGARHAA